MNISSGPKYRKYFDGYSFWSIVKRFGDTYGKRNKQKQKLQQKQE